MKIVIAPDSFKGSLTALQVAEAIEVGLRRVFPMRLSKKYQWQTVVKVPCNLLSMQLTAKS